MIRNWKTTLFGILAGVCNLLASGVTWKQILLSVALAAIGAVAQDAKKPS